MRIGKASAFESKSSVWKLLELDENIAVCEPREMVLRYLLEHPPYLFACLRSTSVAPVSPRQIDSRVCKIRYSFKHPLERGDALGNLALL